MQEKQQESTKTCAQCQKELYGRSDMKFCNDLCRNTYNRQKRAAEKIEEHENSPEIFRIIKQNYEILKKDSHPYDEDESAFMETNDFLAMGINPKFYTNAFTDKDGQFWCCVFERCFTIGEKYTFIKDFPDQAKI